MLAGEVGFAIYYADCYFYHAQGGRVNAEGSVRVMECIDDRLVWAPCIASRVLARWRTPWTWPTWARLPHWKTACCNMVSSEVRSAR